MPQTRRAPRIGTTLPRRAYFSVNRCNLPPQILGGLTFQRHPCALEIDGIHTFHADLFKALDTLNDGAARAAKFQDYMAVQFRLENPEDAGGRKGKGRARADYLRILRGWFFDPDAREGAVLKSWAESRFGLMTRYHKEKISSAQDPSYAVFQKDRAAGLHNTNALEAQLDLVYAYCQYELARTKTTHVTLYRGINRLGDFEIMDDVNPHPVLLFNNVNSFTKDRETADTFGDYILTARVPLAKVFFFSGLLPGLRMTGEDEYIVLGGVYETTRSTL